MSPYELKKAAELKSGCGVSEACRGIDELHELFALVELSGLTVGEKVNMAVKLGLLQAKNIAG